MCTPRPPIAAALRTLLALFALVGSGAARPTETIVFGHIFAATTAHHRALLWAADEIARRTQGRVRLAVYPEGQIGTTDAQVVEGFRTGTADMAYLGMGYLLRLYPRLAIASGPYVFRDFAHWQRFADSNLYRTLAADMDRKLDLKSFGLAYYGARQVTTREPLAGAAGLKGLTIRVPNIPTMVLTFRALDSNPVPIPFKETYQALRDGVVDAQENPLPAIKAMHFHEVTPVVNETAHILDSQIVVMDAKRWAALPSAVQAEIGPVFAEAARRVTREVRAEELALPAQLKALGVRFNPMDREALIARFRPLHHSDYFPWGGELYDRIQALGAP
jgi:tripartite ATP-independent transporter DctP family solute receptor